MSGSNKVLIQEFYSSFQAARPDFSSRLDTLKTEPTISQEKLNQLIVDVAKLRKDLVDATSFLPSYDQRQYESYVKTLEQSLEKLRATSAPKPKFSFKRKQGATLATHSVPPASEKQHDIPSIVSSASLFTGNRVLSEKSRSYLSWSSLPVSSSSSASDLTISDLDSCIVNFLPSLSADVDSPTISSQGEPVRHVITALHVRNVTNSVLLFPPIEGSALLHDLKRCTVVLGCHQFRMHASSAVNVYLSIASNPIIEHCTGIGFTGYPPDLLQLGLDASVRSECKHLSIQDFSHIRATPSPNWYALPKESLVPKADWPVKVLEEDDSIELALQRLLP